MSQNICLDVALFKNTIVCCELYFYVVRSIKYLSVVLPSCAFNSYLCTASPSLPHKLGRHIKIHKLNPCPLILGLLMSHKLMPDCSLFVTKHRSPLCPSLCSLHGFIVRDNSLIDYYAYGSRVILTVVLLVSGQGFMQDKIIASHTCFGGHMDVNC